MRDQRLPLNFIEKMKRKAIDIAGHRGYLTKRQLSNILGLSISTITGIIYSPNFGDIIKKNPAVKQSAVMIPLQSVLDYLDQYHVC
jgi:predicted HTH transcriptional regulator